MDPQQRLLLEGVLEAGAAAAAAAAGPTPGGWFSRFCDGANSAGLTSVYVGVGAAEYHDSVLEPHGASSHGLVATGNALSVTSGRVSFLFGLKGPAASIDTACSSSLVGTHLAARGIAAGDTTSAFACGVHAIFGPRGMKHFFGAGMLSPEGRCKSLDSRADGYVRGEARGVVLMNAMDDRASHDNVGGSNPGGGDLSSSSSSAAVIILDGTSVNQDGRSSSLTAPNGPAQQAAMRSAVADAFQQLGATPLDSMQCHGTGTSLVGGCTSRIQYTTHSLKAPGFNP